MNRKNIYYQYSNKQFTREKREDRKIVETKRINKLDTRDILIKNEIKNLNKQLKTLKINFDKLKNKIT